jgi:glucose/arabinose dehydrogenase
MCTRAAVMGAGIAAVLATSAPADAQDVANFQVWQTGFVEPCFLASPPGEPNRILVGGLRGVIWVVENGVLLPTPFLDIRDRVLTSHGMIGVAFPPDYATSRRFYINYTPLDAEGPRICRYTTSANPNVANRDEENLLETGPGRGDHNSGWMGFGRDGYLYVSRGDVNGIPQDPTYIQGKILRLDVSPPKGYTVPKDNPFVGQAGLDEICMMGVRNPFRCGIDSLTGDLYVADVGNLTMEEITYIPYGTAPGRNLGWPCMEASLCANMPAPCVCNSPAFTAPIHTYTHQEGLAVIGGTVYRGSAIPRWRGRYFFMDAMYSKIWSFRVVNGVKQDLQEHTAPLNEPFSSSSRMNFPITMGEDGNGELYVLELRGRILKIVPESVPADWNMDQTVNSSDFFDFLVDFFAGNADMTGDQATTSQDFFEYLRYFFGK